MPDWYYNYVNVYGKEEDLMKFKEDVALNDEIVFSFNKIVTMPEDTSSWAIEDSPGWYIWTIKNWGPRCGCEDFELNEEKDRLEYEFTSAWDPPCAIYDKMFETYKQLSFEINCWESDNSWVVQITASGGECTKQNFHNTGSVQLKNNLYIDLDTRLMFEL